MPRRVGLTYQGRGRVTGLTNGQLCEVGVTYPVLAKPASGYYFNGWRGAFYFNSPKAFFTMQDNTNVIARFTRTLLGLDTGTYQGVFGPLTNGPSPSIGLLTIKVGANGIYSGRLNPVGASYAIRGQFDSTGQSVISGRLGTNTLILVLVLQAEGSEAIAGGYLDGHNASPLTLWRVQTYGPTNPAPLAGRYTFLLSPPLAANNDLVDGSGFGTVTIDAKGGVLVNGVLADGAPFTEKTALLKGDRFPFYSTVKNGDTVAGLAGFDTNRAFTGSVKWLAPGFPGGTNQNTRLLGGPYLPPPAARLFPWTNGFITLSGDSLATPLTTPVTLQDDGTLAVAANTIGLHLTVTNATGWLDGGFTHPLTHSNLPLRGVILQGGSNTGGFFPGAGRAGRLEIRAAP